MLSSLYAQTHVTARCGQHFDVRIHLVSVSQKKQQVAARVIQRAVRRLLRRRRSQHAAMATRGRQCRQSARAIQVTQLGCPCQSVGDTYWHFKYVSYDTDFNSHWVSYFKTDYFLVNLLSTFCFIDPTWSPCTLCSVWQI